MRLPRIKSETYGSHMTKKSLPSKSILCAAALACGLTSSPAALLVYEGFNGYTVGNISGQATVNTTGLQGNWAAGNVGGGTATYTASGLSFGSNFLSVAGGALNTTTNYSGATSTGLASVRLSTSTTGVLWNSYLVNYSEISLAGGGSAMVGLGASGASPDRFRSYMTTNTVAADKLVNASYDSVVGTTQKFNFNINTTYLMLSSYTNVGSALSAGSPGVATTWVFTLAGYDAWVAAGSNETGANGLNTFASAKATDSVSSSTYLFDNNSYVTLRSNAPNTNGFGVDAIYDEVRYGTTLGDVVSVVPEPSVSLLFGAGVSVFLFGRRRRLV
jgi:hypothetical protein